MFFGEAIQHSHAGSDALLNHGHTHSHSHSDNSRYTDEQENLIQQSTSSYNSYGSTNPADTIKSPVKRYLQKYFIFPSKSEVNYF